MIEQRRLVKEQNPLEQRGQRRSSPVSSNENSEASAAAVTAPGTATHTPTATAIATQLGHGSRCFVGSGSRAGRGALETLIIGANATSAEKNLHWPREEKVDRQGSLPAEVVRKSELSEAKRAIHADKELASKLAERCAMKRSGIIDKGVWIRCKNTGPLTDTLQQHLV